MKRTLQRDWVEHACRQTSLAKLDSNNAVLHTEAVALTADACQHGDGEDEDDDGDAADVGDDGGDNGQYANNEGDGDDAW